jgi:hypothetical protein
VLLYRIVFDYQCGSCGIMCHGVNYINKCYLSVGFCVQYKNIKICSLPLQVAIFKVQ